ncbi:MAG: hypothetical protein WCQ71_01495 [Bacilli bacterium]
MNKPIVAIEISHRAVKLVVGYVLDNQPVVLHTGFQLIPNALRSGEIVDAPLVSEAIKSLVAAIPSNILLKPEDAILALPSIGLQVFQAERSSTVVSPVGKVEQIDVKNVINIIRKDANVDNATVVSIVPELYVLEKGQEFARAPIGMDSASLSITAKIHILPTHICDCYSDVVNGSGIKVRKAFAETYALSKLYANYHNLPDQYLLIDMGEEKTTASLIAGGKLFASTYVMKGGKNLASLVAERLGLSLKDAQRIIENYGRDKTVCSLKAKIASTSAFDQVARAIYLNDLSDVIDQWLVAYYGDINRTIRQLVNEQNNSRINEYPLVFTGGMIHINGLQAAFNQQYSDRQIIFKQPETFGARNGGMSVVLGLLSAYDHYTSEIGDEKTRVASVTRDVSNKKKAKRSANSIGKEEL